MKLSTRSRYGLRAMIAMAMNENNGQMMAKEIAEKQSLPLTYLEQLMVALRKAGIVNATRGAKGGYLLVNTPDNITLADIIEALDGPISIADCSDIANCCIDPDVCSLREVFDGANNLLHQYFKDITLADLVARQRKKQLESPQASMYYI